MSHLLPRPQFHNLPNGFKGIYGLLLMDALLPKKKPRLTQTKIAYRNAASQPSSSSSSTDEDSTDMKLAILQSLFPHMEQNDLLDILVASDGSVDAASSVLSTQQPANPTTSSKKPLLPSSPRIQMSLSPQAFLKEGYYHSPHHQDIASTKPLTRKGKTLHLYSPEDIATHTPCTMIHNFLAPEEANALLAELLEESKTFSRTKFQLFDRTVESPHTARLYVASAEESRQQTTEYSYGGMYRTDVRLITPRMAAVSPKVQRAVNEEVRRRIRSRYPGARKLPFQSPREWVPNAAFVNCYHGPAESVGFHADELTYLGPRPVIGSLSLGVEREFRVRRIVARDDEEDDGEEEATETKTNKKRKRDDAAADAQGQISIHLPHNSLLVMHAEMQEEWKHAIVPAQAIVPHPVSGNRRINVTYRWYRESLHPRYTPRCRCGVPAVLRCVQRKRETRGRYMWMCYAGFAPGKKSCSFFQWAEFDDDGEPIWEKKKPS